ncbi:transposase [Streptomyces profundus]|uniref:transposase n=1 Tax=Streptomyces profundus TaxID=2867410 RepID=UPI001D167C06|nr:transposase [Streptomyces sp. MA3_2.13]UED85075.1 transposase [Streptomyces sp. MA3_2.13]
MGVELSLRLVPDELWELVAPLLPPFPARPQGGGTAPLDERAVFAAVVYVVTSGCAWRRLPATFGVSPATAHRRFTAWSEADVWSRLRRDARKAPWARAEADWASAVALAAAARAGEGTR